MRPKLLLALIPFSFILASCQSEDLEAAKSFGALSQGLATVNQKISADIYSSCARAATWKSLGTFDSRQNMKDELAVCDEQYRANSKNTEIAGSILVNYVSAVGNLATEDEQGFTMQFNAISDALGKLNIDGITINENARQAGVQIAELIANFLVQGFRQDNLKIAIVCTDKDIQAYSAVLSDFIDSSYVNYLLNKEITQINGHYGFYVIQTNRRLEELSGPEDNPQEFKAIQERQTSLEEKERAEIAKVIARKNEGSAYVAAIQSTADFHSKLKRIFNDDQEELSPEQLQQCNEYHSENESLNVENTFEEDNFWNQEITSSQLKQVQKATKEYIAQVTPLLAEIQE